MYHIRTCDPYCTCLAIHPAVATDRDKHRESNVTLSFVLCEPDCLGLVWLAGRRAAPAVPSH